VEVVRADQCDVHAHVVGEGVAVQRFDPADVPWPSSAKSRPGLKSLPLENGCV
jgi:hypothetical protein